MEQGITINMMDAIRAEYVLKQKQKQQEESDKK